MESNRPFASILILNWRAEKYLSTCLAALAAQKFQDFEVILLHNGSPNPETALQNLPLLAEKLTILTSAENLGFAGGNNAAAKNAKGQYLILLNADAFPEPAWLETIHQASQDYPGFFFGSKLIKANNPQTLDGEWNVYHASGLAWRKNHGQALSQGSSAPKEVLSACAAAGVYPKEAFDAVGGFDEDFFAYMEDIDLDLRLQLAGYRCLYLPHALVRHVGSASTGSRSAFQLYYGHRNMVWTFIKNMPGIFFWLLLPAHLFVNLAYLLLGLIIPSGKEIIRGKRDALRGLPQAFSKRNQIQAACRVSPFQIAKLLDWN
ncbi:MAG: glycosyltransferase family 2 protein, partial [Anaerolineaceae bacterium]|nr:glycosyltransferase family 2 protein [Anaerolineaceae bacterium]